LVQQPVGEPSRLGQAGQVALLVQPFGLPDLAVGRRQWSCYAVGSLRRISPARQRYLVTPLPSTSGLGVFGGRPRHTASGAACAVPPHRVLLAGGMIGAILLAFDLWLASAVAPPHVALPDFYVYHLAARIGLAHGWATIYDPSLFQPAVTPVVGRYLPYLNPPLLAWLVAPLTLLPYTLATAIWLGVLGGCLALTAWLAAPGSLPVKAAQLIGALALLPVFIGFEFGQASLLIVAAVAAAWWLIRQDRPLAAGMLLALLALKPQVAALVPFALLLAGYRRVFVGWMLATVPLVVASWLAVGTAGLTGIE